MTEIQLSKVLLNLGMLQKVTCWFQSIGLLIRPMALGQFFFGIMVAQ